MIFFLLILLLKIEFSLVGITVFILHLLLLNTASGLFWNVLLCSVFSSFQVTPNLAETLFRYRTDIEIIFNIIDKDHSGKKKKKNYFLERSCVSSSEYYPYSSVLEVFTVCVDMIRFDLHRRVSSHLASLQRPPGC